MLYELPDHLLAEWHPTKNEGLGIDPLNVRGKGNHIVWWKCPNGPDHEWQQTIATRSYGRRCPVCYGSKVVPSNCLATTHPDYAAQWHPTKNGDLTPQEVLRGSAKTVWWKCPNGPDHEWQAKINKRIKEKRKCPFCIDQFVSETNCLATRSPQAAKLWHPEKNGDSTPSNIRWTAKGIYAWRCERAHEWTMAVDAMVRNPVCRQCEKEYETIVEEDGTPKVVKRPNRKVRERAIRERRLTEGKCYSCGKHPVFNETRNCYACLLRNVGQPHSQRGEDLEHLERKLFDQKHRCIYSGMPLELGISASVDRRVPKAMGGKDELDNLQWVHRWINYIKRDLEEDEFLKKFDEFLTTAGKFRRLF